MISDKKLTIKLIHVGNYDIIDPRNSKEKNLFYMPMGLFSLASEIDKNDFDVEILHMDIERENELDHVLDFSTIDAIGLDCHWVNQSLGIINLINKIKEFQPDIFIFLGGFTGSLFAKEILQDYKNIDAIITGQAEKPIVDLCNILALKKDNELSERSFYNSLQEIPNLVWRSQNVIVINSRIFTATKKELSNYNFTNFRLLKNWEIYRDLCKFWTNFEPFKDFPMFILEIGRGCNFHCSFCGGNAVAQDLIGNKGKVIYRTVESVLNSILEAYEHGYRLFYTCFEFENSDNWYLQLFNEIKTRKLQLSFVFGAWKLPSKKLLDCITECCKNVLFEISPESGNESVRSYNKDKRLDFSNSKLINFLDYIKRTNVYIQLYYGYFLPNDTKKTINTTLLQILNLALNYPHSVEIMYSNLSTDPYSLLYQNPEKYNVDIAVKSFDDYLSYQKLFYKNKLIKPDLTLFRPKLFSDNDFIKQTYKIEWTISLLKNFKKTIEKLHFNSINFIKLFEYFSEMDQISFNSQDSYIEHAKYAFSLISDNSEEILSIFESELKERTYFVYPTYTNALCIDSETNTPNYGLFDNHIEFELN